MHHVYTNKYLKISVNVAQLFSLPHVLHVYTLQSDRKLMKAVIHKKKTIFYLVKVKDQKAFGVAILLFYLPQACTQQQRAGLCISSKTARVDWQLANAPPLMQFPSFASAIHTKLVGNALNTLLFTKHALDQIFYYLSHKIMRLHAVLPLTSVPPSQCHPLRPAM